MASVYNQFTSGMSGVDQHIASSKSEFQVVILAGGTNHRMLPLTEKCPKAMLPVANQPLLEFQLELVRRAGFSEVIVVTTHEHKAQVNGVVEKYSERPGPTLSVDLVAVEDKKDDGSALGSADALREIKDKIKTDFMVLSGDLVAEWLGEHLPETLEDFEDEGGDELELILTRALGRDGRSRAHVNHRPVTQRMLRELASRLVEIHGQNDHQKLFDPGEQMRLLDTFGELGDTLAGYRERRATWLELAQSLDRFQTGEVERLQRLTGSRR